MMTIDWLFHIPLQRRLWCTLPGGIKWSLLPPANVIYMYDAFHIYVCVPVAVSLSLK